MDSNKVFILKILALAPYMFVKHHVDGVKKNIKAWDKKRKAKKAKKMKAKGKVKK